MTTHVYKRVTHHWDISDLHLEMDVENRTITMSDEPGGTGDLVDLAMHRSADQVRFLLDVSDALVQAANIWARTDPKRQEEEV